MSWNGSGVYSLPALYFPEAPGNLVDSDRYNGTLQDLATGLNVALTKNGQNTATADLPMGGFKHTGAANATSAGHYIVFGQAATLGALGLTGVLTSNSPIIPSNGSAAAPSFTFGSFQTSGFYSNAGEVSVTINGVRKASFESTGDVIFYPAASPPALTINGQMVMNLTSNTNLRISARGSDGVTRVANITLA